jgi:hypothetical protein
VRLKKRKTGPRAQAGMSETETEKNETEQDETEKDETEKDGGR